MADEVRSGRAPLPNLTESPTSAVEQLVATFITRTGSQNTARSYRGAIEAFARFLRLPAVDAIGFLLGTNGEGAAQVMTRYKRQMVDNRAAARSINLRLGVLRSLVDLARSSGLVTWRLETDAVPVSPRSSGAVIRHDDFSHQLDQVAGDSGSPTRNRAIISLIYDAGLRRGEITSLNIADVDLQRRAITVASGRAERARRRQISPEAAIALRQWIELRGTDDGPLFISLDRASGRGRLSGESVRQVVKEFGAAFGNYLAPGALRRCGMARAVNDLGISFDIAEQASKHNGPGRAAEFRENGA